MKILIFAGLLLVSVLAWQTYDRHATRRAALEAVSQPSAAQEAPPPAQLRFSTTPAQGTEGPFRCDGRQYCSQMHSCAEATYFLNNCPDTKMDGNHDGVPCEQQFCRS